MVQPTLILASGSPRRQELIRTFGLAVRIDPADVDETMPEGTPPDVLVEQLSLRKAQTVSGRGGHEGGGIVVGSDTVVVLDGRILGKPKDEQEAVDMLRALAGRTHRVYTGIACIDVGKRSELARRETSDVTIRRNLSSDEGLTDRAELASPSEFGRYRVLSELPDGQPEVIAGHTVSQVTFSPMNEDEIAAYVKSGEPMDKAGAYGVQGLGAVFVEKIDGDFYSIMGLPLHLLYVMLLKFGISPFMSRVEANTQRGVPDCTY